MFCSGQSGGGKIEGRRGLNVRAAPKKNKVAESGLNRFRCWSADRSVRALCKGVVRRILLGALIDFDRAFEVGAVFDHDAGGRQIAVDGTVLLDLDPV